MWPVMHAGTETPLWTKWHIGVKTLPYPKVCLWVVKYTVAVTVWMSSQGLFTLWQQRQWFYCLSVHMKWILMAMESLLSWMGSVQTYETVHMVTDSNGYFNSKVAYVCVFLLFLLSQNGPTTHLPMMPLPLPLPSVTIWTVSYVCTEPIHDEKKK